MFRTAQRILLAKPEVTYGTDPVPTVAANAVKARNVKVNYVGDVLEANEEKQSLSPSQPQIGKRYIEVNFEVAVRGSGTRGTAPEIGDLLKACGFAETVSAGSSVTYTPASINLGSVTLYVYDLPDVTGNARLHRILGAVGTVKIKYEAGQKMVYEFRFMGKYTARTDVSVPSTPTYDPTLAPVVNASAFALNSITSLVVQSLEIDMANKISERPDINDATSIGGFFIGGRNPNGSFNPEAVLAATYDFLADWVAATKRALTITAGATAGNIIETTSAGLTIDTINDEDRNEVRVDGMPFHLSGDDNELSIIFR